ncbi:transposase [Nocardia farcinica]|uniref:transposase n=1 Tax=Nocardia farcinica TaxID=37329 RepID=UPI0022B24EA9|nr:transposase [Nocardia farcinica]
MVDELSKRLVPDELWELVEPLLPEFSLRAQGGGTAPVDQRAVFTAVVYVLASVRVADVAAVVRGHGADGASPVHRVDRDRGLAAVTSGCAPMSWVAKA